MNKVYLMIFPLGAFQCEGHPTLCPVVLDIECDNREESDVEDRKRMYDSRGETEGRIGSCSKFRCFQYLRCYRDNKSFDRRYQEGGALTVSSQF